MLDELPLRDHFVALADVVARDGGTTYPEILRGVADDPDVLSLLDHAPVEQRRPLILLAAVHSMLLAGSAHELAGYYDTVADVRGFDFDPPADDVAEVFRSFCVEHRRQIEELVATRATQTNEVGRCTALLPGLCHVAAAVDEAPLSVLDLGTSAGLNLLFDCYGYTYSDDSGATRTAGDTGSPVQLRCQVRGGLATLPDLAMPTIHERVGLDLSPIDPSDDDQARWLLACVWPDNPTRFGRLRGALDIARTTTEPARLVQGDMIEDLDWVARDMAGDNPLVIFHSWVAAYLSAERQRALVAAVEALHDVRPVHHLYAESAFETTGLPTPERPEPLAGADLATALVHVAPGSEPVRVADAHPHGNWLRWWTTRRVPTARRGAGEPAPPPG